MHSVSKKWDTWQSLNMFVNYEDTARANISSCNLKSTSFPFYISKVNVMSSNATHIQFALCTDSQQFTSIKFLDIILLIKLTHLFSPSDSVISFQKVSILVLHSQTMFSAPYRIHLSMICFQILIFSPPIYTLIFNYHYMF